MKILPILFSLLLGFTASVSAQNTSVKYGYETVDGVNIFFREAGHKNNKPTLVLLHGFPSSSHQYREVLNQLGNEYHIIAPDYPGYGNSDFPPISKYEYTFDNIAKTMDNFLIQRGLSNYVLMIQDFGAPIGFRIATAHPEKVAGFVVMNGNAYEEGLSPSGWGKLREYWKKKTPELEKYIVDNVFSLEGMKWQYTHGTRNPKNILPDNWKLDYLSISRKGQKAAQLSMLFDYQNNLALYPHWQAYLRKMQPPMLLVWGKNDAFFPVSGAEAYKKDVKNIDYNILNTGHFALEEEAAFIIDKIRHFMELQFYK